MGNNMCSAKESKFAKCKNQIELEELVKKEKEKYYKKCDEMSLKFFSDVIEQTSLERNGTKAIDYVKNKSIYPFKVLQKFIEGLNLIEKEMKKKKYSNIDELIMLVERYIEHGNDQDEIMILSFNESIKQWFLKNSE
jgi:hypothetical protein